MIANSQHSHFYEILADLIRSPSVVGAEHSFFRVLQRELEERNAKVTWYEGLLVAQGSDPTSMMFSAHIDRHGLICTGPNEFQYAAFVAGTRSDLLGNSVSEELINKIVDRFQAIDVYAYEPWSGAYRGTGRIERSYKCEFRNNLIFELQGMDHLVAGTPVAFRDKLRVSDHHIAGQLDNVFSAAALIYLFENNFEGTAFFTAQEEAGKSWRYLLEWFRRFGGSTNQLVVLDTSPYATLEEADAREIILRHRDANAEFNANLTQRLQLLCEDLAVKFEFKDEYINQKNQLASANGEKTVSLGSTELGRIVAASNKLVDGTTLQLPTSGYHTMEETAAVKSVDAFLNILLHLGSVPFVNVSANANSES